MQTVGGMFDQMNVSGTGAGGAGPGLAGAGAGGAGAGAAAGGGLYDAADVAVACEAFPMSGRRAAAPVVVGNLVGRCRLTLSNPH